MHGPKILQTIRTLHILTVFYITETGIGTILLLLAHYLHFFLQKGRDTLTEQSLTLIEQSGKAKIL